MKLCACPAYYFPYSEILAIVGLILLASIIGNILFCVVFVCKCGKRKPKPTKPDGAATKDEVDNPDTEVSYHADENVATSCATSVSVRYCEVSLTELSMSDSCGILKKDDYSAVKFKNSLLKI